MDYFGVGRYARDVVSILSDFGLREEHTVFTYEKHGRLNHRLVGAKRCG